MKKYYVAFDMTPNDLYSKSYNHIGIGLLAASDFNPTINEADPIVPKTKDNVPTKHKAH